MDIDKKPGFNNIFTPFGLHSTVRRRDGLRNSRSFESVKEVNLGFNLGVTPFSFGGYYSELPDHGLMALGVDSLEKIQELRRKMRNRIERVTPFAPEKGYQITQEDYNHEAREKKLKAMHDQSALMIEGDDEFPLSFWVSAPHDLLVDRGLGIFEDDNEFSFKFNSPIHENFLRRLRLQVSFPTWLRYEARPDYTSLVDEGNLHFHLFYPLALTPTEEPGPLASEYGTRGGVEILLPETFVDLSKIQARFILADTPVN